MFDHKFRRRKSQKKRRPEVNGTRTEFGDVVKRAKERLLEIYNTLE